MGQYGNVDAAWLQKGIDRPVSMKANLHNAVFHPATLEAWVAVAGKDGEPACTQPYHRFQLIKQADWTVKETTMIHAGE